MKKNTVLNVTIFLIIAIILLALVVSVLKGENGLIAQEREKYNETHSEENADTNNMENTIVVKQF